MPSIGKWIADRSFGFKDNKSAIYCEYPTLCLAELRKQSKSVFQFLLNLSIHRENINTRFIKLEEKEL
jgi:hypothetical protein